MKVTIEFSTSFDDKTKYTKDRYENLVYDDNNYQKARKFINNLRNNDLPKSGGQKKKQRKTRKNKKLHLLYH
jgi:hypothetical protein